MCGTIDPKSDEAVQEVALPPPPDPVPVDAGVEGVLAETPAPPRGPGPLLGEGPEADPVPVATAGGWVCTKANMDMR